MLKSLAAAVRVAASHRATMFTLPTIRRLPVFVTLLGLVSACVWAGSSLPADVTPTPSPTVPVTASLAPTPSPTAVLGRLGLDADAIMEMSAQERIDAVRKAATDGQLEADQTSMLRKMGIPPD